MRKKTSVFEKPKQKKYESKILQNYTYVPFFKYIKTMWEKKVTLKSGKTKLINHCGEIYFSSVHLQPIQKQNKKNGKEI